MRYELLSLCASALVEVHGVDEKDFDALRDHNSEYGRHKQVFHDMLYYWEDVSMDTLQRLATEYAKTTAEQSPLNSINNSTVHSDRLVPRLYPATVDMTLLNWKEVA